MHDVVARWGAGRLECTWATLTLGGGVVIGDRRQFRSFVVRMVTGLQVYRQPIQRGTGGRRAQACGGEYDRGSLAGWCIVAARGT